MEPTNDLYTGIHPAAEALLAFFAYEHLPEKLQEVSKPFGELARDLVLPDRLGLEGAEATTALRKLLEAKDCAVRAALPVPRFRSLCAEGVHHFRRPGEFCTRCGARE